MIILVMFIKYNLYSKYKLFEASGGIRTHDLLLFLQIYEAIEPWFALPTEPLRHT